MEPLSQIFSPQQTAPIRYVLIGAAYALSAALQPGPLQAFFLSRVARQGWKRTLPAAFAPLLSDGPIALVAITILGILPSSFRNWLHLAGGILLLVYARSALAAWRQPPSPERDDRKAVPGTIFQAALINLLNPAPYLGWSLVMGPEVIAAWEQAPWLAAVLLGGFYLVLISTSIAIIFLMGQALLIGPRASQTLSLISGLLLVGLGLYFLIQAAGGLLEYIL